MANVSVYRFSGEDVKEDPRRTSEYKTRVVEGLGFGRGETRKGLTEADMEACRRVLRRKAGAFWIEGSPRTALRYLLHDTIPTGPPCRTPPHRLKGEEADWVDDQLQSEVISGQLVRGNSEWASPPFATKSFAEHRKQRKRRLVVDYRRVNQRILRAVYFVRSADGVVQEVAGSMFLSLVDACKGFNQVANTRRAREVLAILARSGQYLPICLTFGPTNGPEDFAFATDRVLAPGRGRRRRFCTNWQIYAADITVRSGKWVNWRNAKGGFLKGGKAKLKLKRNCWQGSSPQELSGLAREARTSRRTGSTSSSWTNSFYSFINATCSSGWQLLGVPFLTHFGECNLGMQEASARNPYKSYGSSMCAHVCSPAHCT